jgi:hypothetical protein
MKGKTLLLFQLFLAVFAFYALLKYPGNIRFLVPLACLIGMFVLAKFETSLTQSKNHGEGQSSDTRSLQSLDCLLKSKNVLLLTDAIHYLIQDLGLPVAACPDNPGVDRLIKIPGTQVTLGLKILGDLGELDENSEKWEEVANFDLGRGGNRRLVIIASNCAKEAGDSKDAYQNFSGQTEKFLSARHIVAMSTLTLNKIYVFCKKKNVDPAKLFRLIQRHPGGVFQLEHYLRPSNQGA